MELDIAVGSRCNVLYGPVLEPLARGRAATWARIAKSLRVADGRCYDTARSWAENDCGRRCYCWPERPSAKLTADHIVLGTVIEMVHTATLVHDDVLDDAETRRHVPTINARWNQHTSILLGDYLFAQSFRLAATLPSTEACRWIGEAARLVCEGELRQVLAARCCRDGRGDLPEHHPRQDGRAVPSRLPAGRKILRWRGRVVEALGNYGDAVGIAFQIADDYLDLWGDDETVGKTLGTDIGQGKMTLPIIRLLETASRIDRSRIVGILRGPADKRLEQIRPYLQRSDARQYTRRVAGTIQAPSD